MRYQQPIYVQNNSNVIRNSDILNVNMSSDICIYEQPRYTVSGGCKIVSGLTTGDTCVHIVNGYSELVNLGFLLTGGTTATTFNLEIYKYDSQLSGFSDSIVYQELNIPLSASFNTEIVAATLNMDGEYLIKIFFHDFVCTDILGRLGLTIDTKDYFVGELYDKYVPDLDFYFVLFTDATIPLLNIPSGNVTPLNSLYLRSIIPDFDGQTQIYFTDNYNGEIIVNLNGLTLSKNIDYTILNNLITFNSGLKTSDIITLIGVIGSNNNVNSTTHDSFVVPMITSGSTGGEGSNSVYYNTDTNKYEIFTSLNQNGGVIVSINGVTLAPYIDYNSDLSNPRKIILEGNLIVDDIILIIYQSIPYVQNSITLFNPEIIWRLLFPPQNTLGYFEFYLSDDSNCSNIIFSGTQNYIIGEIMYSQTLDLTGYGVGDTLYYKIINHKIYETISGDILERIKTTEVVPITIMANS